MRFIHELTNVKSCVLATEEYTYLMKGRSSTDGTNYCENVHCGSRHVTGRWEYGNRMT